ncbi:MAG: DnaJ domain-containing protein [SAR324 cluster bacterium]|nr:DnaJ domain-containing protein [SAR324 cluster bacterium]
MEKNTDFTWRNITLIGLLLCLSTTVNFALVHAKTITETQSIEIPFPAETTAISSDEALVAVSMTLNDEDSLVQVYDRQSLKPIFQILSKGNPVKQLKFDHYTRRIALAGKEKVQLWDLEEIPIQPDKPLSSEYILDEKDQNISSTSLLNFSKKSQRLTWVGNQQIQNFEIEEKPYRISTIWTGDHSIPPQSFSFDPEEEWLAFSLENEKRIKLANPKTKETKQDLDYHHFPVMKVEFLDEGTLLSLDSERNLIWGNVNNRTKIHGLFLRNLSEKETTLDFQRIHQDRFLAILTKNISTSKFFAHIIDKNGSLLDTIPLVGVNSFSSSPTGKYILTNSTPLQIDLHQFLYHENPQNYIRTLIEKGASEMARRYQNHLESPPPELSVVNQKSWTVQSLVERLSKAIKAEKWIEAKPLVEQILLKDPNNPDALEAEKILINHQNLLALSEGKRKIEEEHYEQAIGILVQIPKESPYREEARRLISSAEEQILLIQALEKSKREVRLKNWEKAKALLAPVLEQDPNNPTALSIQDEIESNQTSSQILDIFTAFAIFGLLGGIGFYLARKRTTVLDWISLKEKSSPNLKPPLKAKPDPFFDDTPEKRQFLETLQKAKTVLRLSKEADRSGKHTARLIDFEAEISVIQKKASQVKGNYQILTNQLLHILQTIRGFNFGAETQNTGKKTQQKNKKETPKNSNPNQPIQQNYYQILNVAHTASSAEIKQAYHQLMKKYHPDLHQNSGFEWIKKEADAKTKLIQKAYDVLKNHQSRQQYDKNTTKYN